MQEERTYDDSYGTCSCTYATLRIYHDDLDPGEVTDRLGISPSGSQRKGERNPSRPGRETRYPISGWFLATEHEIDSLDSRRHIDWLLDHLEGKDVALRELRARGFRTDLSCCWVSKDGHGGPTLMPYQMERLARLGLEFWYDFYS